MKIMLLFPPQFDVTMPRPELPSLFTILKKEGHDVILKDVNVESYNYLLSKKELKRAYEAICFQELI